VKLHLKPIVTTPFIRRTPVNQLFEFSSEDVNANGKKPLAKTQKRNIKQKTASTPKEEKAPSKVAPNNKLNELTGAEWKFSTKSVINKPYPVNLQHKLRSQHGGQKPPQLCADLISTFTKTGQIVLDPFGGVGGTLLGASLVGRRATGIELDQRWIDIYKQVCELESLSEQEFLNGDSKVVLTALEKESFDFLLTDVPYWNIDKIKQTRAKTAKASKLSEFNEEHSQTKEEWLDEMAEIISKCHPLLKANAYAAVFIGDMYRGSQYHILHAELAQKIEASQLFTLKANLVWYDVSKMLHVYGYPAAFVPSMIHQNILIFRKN
jgi:DNA modification methylase